MAFSESLRWRVCALLLLISLAWSGCGDSHGERAAAILLFNGTGTSPNDVKAIEGILDDNHLDYAKADSAQLNAMDEARLREFRLLIVPGGNFLEMENGLTTNAAAAVRDSVRDGLNYLGICAGALLAGNSPSNGFNLTDGVRYGFYAVVNQGIHKAAVPITFAQGPTLAHYWEDGPELAGWGATVGKYPDGAPAIVEGTCGKGWVILCGFHPEAPERWRRGMTFATPAAVDNDYALTLIRATLNREPLAHF